MMKRILNGLLCLVLILALTAQIVPEANASWSANLSSPIHLKMGQEYKKTWIITYVGIDDDTDISVEGTVPGISFITERGYTVGPSALFYYEGTPTMPGTYSVTLRVRKPEIGLNKEVTYTFEIDGDISVNSVNLVLSGYGAGASVSNANIQIKTEGVEFAVQGAANGFVFQATDSRTAAAITSGTFQENTDYYVMVILDIKSGYLRNYDTDNITLTVNGQTATKASGGMNNIAGNNSNSKLLVRFKLPQLKQDAPETLSPMAVYYHDGEGKTVELLKSTDSKREITVYLDELGDSVSGGLVHFVTCPEPWSEEEGIVSFTSSNTAIHTRFSVQKVHADRADEVVVLFSKPGTTTITAQLANGAKQTVTVTVKESRNPSADLVGDFNSDGKVDAKDVAYLLWHTLFPSSYPINQSADFNNDSKVDAKDVAYLLWHTLFPGSYPL